MTEEEFQQLMQMYALQNAPQDTLPFNAGMFAPPTMLPEMAPVMVAPEPMIAP